MHSNNSPPLMLLHVDDDENDRALVKEAIEITKTPFKYLGAPSLQTAVGLLELPLRGPHSQPVQPALILLDYNLGSRCGVDFLCWLRTVKKTDVRVVMLSGSDDESEIAECYVHGANHFLTKPQNLDRIKNLVQRLYQCVTNSSESLRRLTEYRGNATEACCPIFEVGFGILQWNRPREAAGKKVNRVLDSAVGVLKQMLKFKEVSLC